MRVEVREVVLVEDEIVVVEVGVLEDRGQQQRR